MSLDEKLIDPSPSRERILGTSTSLVTDRGGDGSLGEVAIAHYVPTGTLELVYHLSHLYLKSGSDQMPGMNAQQLGYRISYGVGVEW
nr:hypothetical protein [Ferrimicrobium acidiphilum]